MTTQNSNPKTDLLRLYDDLDDLQSAYEALQVISVGSSGDAVHVGQIINVLNVRFQTVLAQLSQTVKAV